METNTLGGRVKQLRTKMGLTQLQLSIKLYVSESYIALIEADKRNPSMEIVSKLADFFCVTSDYLINGEQTDEEKLMLMEWSAVLKGRSKSELDGAMKLVKSFFECVDESKKQNHTI